MSCRIFTTNIGQAEGGATVSNSMCPTCKQDMRDDPRPGWHGKDCPQCGQGLPAPKGRKLRKAIKRRHP